MTRRLWILIVAAIALGCTFGVATFSRRTVAQLGPPPPPPVVVTFSYDSLGRVVQEIYPANSVAYNYDAAGNRTSFTLR